MLKNLDSFGKNVVIALAGTSLLNFFNLACQLLIAHRLAPVDFAALNSLLALCMIIAAPFSTLQPAVTKYISEFCARSETARAKAFFLAVLKTAGIIAAFIFCIFYFSAPLIVEKLKVPGLLPVYILGGLISASCILPVFAGAVQGRELFGWFSGVSAAAGLLKLGLVLGFLALGLGISGALGAFFAASIISIPLFFFPLKDYFFSPGHQPGVNFKEFLAYLFPVAASFLCFMALASADMIMVKYYFNAEKIIF